MGEDEDAGPLKRAARGGTEETILITCSCDIATSSPCILYSGKI